MVFHEGGNGHPTSAGVGAPNKNDRLQKRHPPPLNVPMAGRFVNGQRPAAGVSRVDVT
ncbi:MAG: hypothetical protein KJ970_04040 [Candidatus Eisenbacteria bacterium]|uniref:Uncharacterized protein n=1 Tax=Eiseniibacteriota bacterium TaxID=2212470 RepID=A0A948RUR7_UNCEI|nr:hypothetical protein [Candidatus Eisenbacteria bacterium]